MPDKYARIISKSNKIISENTLHCINHSETVNVYQLLVVNVIVN